MNYPNIEMTEKEVLEICYKIWKQAPITTTEKHKYARPFGLFDHACPCCEFCIVEGNLDGVSFKGHNCDKCPMLSAWGTNDGDKQYFCEDNENSPYLMWQDLLNYDSWVYDCIFFALLIAEEAKRILDEKYPEG